MWAEKIRLNVLDCTTILSLDTRVLVYDWGIFAMWICTNSPIHWLHLFPPDCFLTIGFMFNMFFILNNSLHFYFQSIYRREKKQKHMRHSVYKEACASSIWLFFNAYLDTSHYTTGGLQMESIDWFKKLIRWILPISEVVPCRLFLFFSIPLFFCTREEWEMLCFFPEILQNYLEHRCHGLKQMAAKCHTAYAPFPITLLMFAFLERDHSCLDSLSSNSRLRFLLSEHQSNQMTICSLGHRWKLFISDSSHRDTYGVIFVLFMKFCPFFLLFS